MILMADLANDIRLAVDSGKAVFGVKESVDSMMASTAKVVVVASSNKKDRINDILHLAKLSDCYFSNDGHIPKLLYDDEDLKVASFFHELGHCLDQEPDPEFPDCLPFALKSDRELRAWKVGFKIAEEQYGVRFSSATLGWCLDQVRTHLHWRG